MKKFPYFCGSFLPSLIRIRTSDLIESGSETLLSRRWSAGGLSLCCEEKLPYYHSLKRGIFSPLIKFMDFRMIFFGSNLVEGRKVPAMKKEGRRQAKGQRGLSKQEKAEG
jgi:hypothetical protein